MDLAIAGDFFAAAVEDHGRIVDLVLAGDLFEDRAGMDEYAMPPRQILHRVIGRAVAENFSRGLFFGTDAAKKDETLRQAHPVGLLFGHGTFDEFGRRSDVRLLRMAGIHLDQGDFHCRRIAEPASALCNARRSLMEWRAQAAS